MFLPRPTILHVALSVFTGFLPLSADAAQQQPIILKQILLSQRNTTDSHAIPATFGDPPQTINLALSTTSQHSWVYSATFCDALNSTSEKAACAASATTNGGATGFFDRTKSTKWSEKASTSFAYQGPSNGMQFTGIFGTDKVNIGGVDVPAFEFGIVQSVGTNIPSVLSMTGIEGSIGGVLGVGAGSPFLKYLIDNKMIQSSTVGVQVAAKIAYTDDELVSKYPQRRIVPWDTESLEFEGSIILGGYDESKLNASAPGAAESGLQTNALTAGNEISVSTLKMEFNYFNDSDLGQLAALTSFESDTSDGFETVIDSTSPFILMPTGFWNQVKPSWRRAAINTTTGKAYYVNPTGHRDWRNFTLTLKDSNSTTGVRQIVMQHFDWNVWDPELNFWAPAFKLQPEGVNTLVLGRPAMRALYVAVDWDKEKATTAPIQKRTNDGQDVVSVVSWAERQARITQLPVWAVPAAVGLLVLMI